MEKETYTNVKLTKAELKKMIAQWLQIDDKQITSFDNYEVPDQYGFDGYSFGGINLTYKHNE